MPRRVSARQELLSPAIRRVAGERKDRRCGGREPTAEIYFYDRPGSRSGGLRLAADASGAEWFGARRKIYGSDAERSGQSPGRTASGRVVRAAIWSLPGLRARSPRTSKKRRLYVALSSLGARFIAAPARAVTSSSRPVAAGRSPAAVATDENSEMIRIQQSSAVPRSDAGETTPFADSRTALRSRELPESVVT